MPALLFFSAGVFSLLKKWSYCCNLLVIAGLANCVHPHEIL